MKFRIYLPSLLLAAFVFSPRIIGPFRLGDLLTLVAVIAFIPEFLRARAPGGEWSGEWNGVEKSFFALLLVISATTLLSLVSGINGRGESAALAIGRLLELSAVYFISMNCAGSAAVLKKCALACVIIFLAWGAVEMIHTHLAYATEYHRAFNEGWFRGEANHVAGALVVLSIMATGGHSRSGTISAIAAILFSGSRAAFAAAIAAHARALLAVGRYRSLILFAALSIALFSFAPQGTVSRWLDILGGRAPYNGPHVDRMTAWSVAILETPVLTGTGFGSRPSSVYESCYVLLYAEAGIVGLASYLFLLAAMVIGSHRKTEELEMPAMGIALAVLSLTSNVLLIARIAAPAAIIMGALRASRASRDPEAGLL